MQRNPALEADIDVEQGDAEGVKGGGIVDVTASALGTTVTASENGASVTGSTATASADLSGASASAGSSGVSAKAGAKTPRVKPRHRRH